MSVSAFNVLSKQNVKLVKEVLLKGDKFSTCFSQTPHKFHYTRSIKSPLPSWRPNPILEFSSELSLFDYSVAFLLLTSLPFFKFLPLWCPWDAPAFPALSLLAASPSSQIPLWLLFFHPCLMLMIPEFSPWLFSYSSTCSTWTISTTLVAIDTNCTVPYLY